MADLVRWSDRVAEAEPVVGRLRHGSYTVTALVPAGFAGYARLLHPIVTVTPTGRNLTRWRTLTPGADTRLGRRVQFPHLAEAVGADPQDRPPIGSLPVEDARILVEVLTQFTRTPRHCWFCLWDGYGWPHAGPAFRRAPAARHMARTPPPDRVARVHTPYRDYLLYSGPVDAALALIEAAPWWEQTPNLWWPADLAWCVATDIDLDSTYIGGSTPLIDSLLADPRLEVLPAHPDDSITLDADVDDPPPT